MYSINQSFERSLHGSNMNLSRILLVPLFLATFSSWPGVGLFLQNLLIFIGYVQVGHTPCTWAINQLASL